MVTRLSSLPLMEFEFIRYVELFIYINIRDIRVLNLIKKLFFLREKLKEIERPSHSSNILWRQHS